MGKDDSKLMMSYNDIEYEINGDEKKIAEHLYFIMDQLKELKNQENRLLQINLKINRNSSQNIQDVFNKNFTEIKIDSELRTFVETLGTRIEWIYCLGIAFYLIKNEDENIITAKKIKDSYAKAGIRQPQNIHLSVNQCVKKEFMKEVGKVKGLKAFTVTNRGIDFIERQIKSDCKDDKQVGFENEEQEIILNQFLKSLSQKEIRLLRSFEKMEDRILVLMYLLKEKDLAIDIRPNFMYFLIVRMYGYDGLPRSVHLGLSRTRPLTKKTKLYNKIHYRIEQEGIHWVEKEIALYES